MHLSDISNPVINASIGTSSTDPATATSRLLSALINFGLVAGSTAFVFMLLLGGYQWITSGGDKDALSKAKNRISNALIGLVVMFSLYAFLSLLSGFLGFNLLKLKLPPPVT